MEHNPVTVEDIKKMEYKGGGYFRLPAPTGQNTKIIHGPEIQRILLKHIARLEKQISDAGWALEGYQQEQRDNFGNEWK